MTLVIFTNILHHESLNATDLIHGQTKILNLLVLKLDQRQYIAFCLQTFLKCIDTYIFSWTYSSPDDLGGTSFNGIMGNYDAGGYYQDLSHNENKTRALIMELKHSLWITRATRVVLIDFTIYNANLNLFAVCRLVGIKANTILVF